MLNTIPKFIIKSNACICERSQKVDTKKKEFCHEICLESEERKKIKKFLHHKNQLKTVLLTFFLT